jgi:hypothetical protein
MNLTHKSQIYEKAKFHTIFSSVNVRWWGEEMYCLNPDRRLRELVNDGKIFRLNKKFVPKEKEHIGWYATRKELGENTDEEQPSEIHPTELHDARR